MRTLVTGGAGFMGSNFIRHLLSKYPEYEVINLDKLTYAGNLANLRDVENDPRYAFVRGDIADEKVVEEVFSKGIDMVVNYAAETHVDRSIVDPKSFIMTDVLGTYTLLEACRKHGIQKYVQVSTDEVFGSIEDGEFTESSPFCPNSPYSAAKAGGDHLCRAYFTTYGMPVIVTHSCNFIGPYQYPEKFIALSITNILEGKKIPIYGDGRQVREWIYTADHCNAIDTIVHRGKPGEIYNIGIGERHANINIARKIIALVQEQSSSDGETDLNPVSPKEEKQWIEHVTDRLGHDVRYAIDSTKLRTQLDWNPQYSFDRALKATIRWYRENEAWWKPLKEDGWFEEQYKQT